jgi:hypothetical protein
MLTTKAALVAVSCFGGTYKEHVYIQAMELFLYLNCGITFHRNEISLNYSF